MKRYCYRRMARALWVVCLIVLNLTPFVPAVTPADGDAAFAALNAVYWNPEANYFRKEETGDQLLDFWLEAQLWDTVMDRYDCAPSDAVRRQIDAVYDGFVAQYPDWTSNKYNDDIMWWTIACTRAYRITQNPRYLKQATFWFDYVYDHFHDDTFGGGIWWTSDRRSKNSCIVSPAVIAAVRLSQLLKDTAYLDKAQTLYQWQKKTLTDGTGKVFDNIEYTRRRRRDAAANAATTATTTPSERPSRIRTFSLTYNQGTYIGASLLLYQATRDKAYLDEAKQTADWTRDHLCKGPDRILQSEGQGDGGAFKGIFVRYIHWLIKEAGLKEYLPWMRANAKAAWRNRRSSDNIMGYDWSAPTGSGIQCQSAASAVSLILCFPDETKKP